MMASMEESPRLATFDHSLLARNLSSRSASLMPTSYLRADRGGKFAPFFGNSANLRSYLPWGGERAASPASQPPCRVGFPNLKVVAPDFPTDQRFRDISLLMARSQHSRRRYEFDYARPKRPQSGKVGAALAIVGALGVGYVANGASLDSFKAALPGSGCDIKGNVSIETGQRIYHVPGQEYYDVTIIRPEYGEQWFCSEAEARDAGWRRSKS